MDYTYEEATPPLALEVSTVQDDKFLAGANESRKLEERLTTLSEAKSLSGYSIVLKSIGRYRVSNDASRSSVPGLAAGLARLWVVHLWRPAGKPMVVWS